MTTRFEGLCPFQRSIQQCGEITQPTLRDRLKGTAYLWIRFKLAGVPTQQATSYNWRNRLSLDDQLKTYRHCSINTRDRQRA